jgi:hypothetical protein
MHVEIRTEAAQFPEKKYINGIFLAAWNILQIIYRERYKILPQKRGRGVTVVVIL